MNANSLSDITFTITAFLPPIYTETMFLSLPKLLPLMIISSCEPPLSGVKPVTVTGRAGLKGSDDLIFESSSHDTIIPASRIRHAPKRISGNRKSDDFTLSDLTFMVCITIGLIYLTMQSLNNLSYR